MVILLYPYAYLDFVNLHLHTGIGYSPFAYGYTHMQMVIIDVPMEWSETGPIVWTLALDDPRHEEEQETWFTLSMD